MSTINSKNVQVGTSGTATDNFTLYQPATPDGTVRLGVGNSGATTLDVFTATSAGAVTFSGAVTVASVSGSGAALTALNASNLSTGTVPDARFPAMLPAASGANLTSLNASNLSSGTVATARLATGTADSTTYLRGDQTWAAVSTTPTTAQVLSATAGASVGAVGTYALCFDSATVARNPGDTLAGSTLRYTSADGAPTTTAPAGTWRIMGATTVVNNRSSTSVWLRIS